MYDIRVCCSLSVFPHLLLLLSRKTLINLVLSVFCNCCLFGCEGFCKAPPDFLDCKNLGILSWMEWAWITGAAPWYEPITITGGLISKRAQLSLFICCSFVPCISPKELLSCSTRYMSTEAARQCFFSSSFSSRSLDELLLLGGVVSQPTIAGARQGHYLSNGSIFFVHVHDAFLQKKD